MNFGFSGEMIFLFLLALILFGPKKMPEIGRQVARFLNEFRRASNEFRSQIESEINSLDNANPSGSSHRQQILPPLQAPLGSLANRIFNPPPVEKLEAAETPTAENTAAVETGLAPSPEPALAPSVEAPAVEASGVEARKVAPDA
jgi:sec-independent protein translocase protein TatB